MNCQDVQKTLLELRENEVEETVTAEVRAHLQACSDCQREWEITQQFLKFWTDLSAFQLACEPLPPEEQPHLNIEELLAMAEYTGEELTSGVRARWQHALECHFCYDTCAWLRELRAHPDAVPQIHLPLEAVINALQMIKLRVAVHWARTGMILRSAAAVAQPRIRGGSEIQIIEHAFKDYVLKMTLRPASREKKTCLMHLALSARTPEVSLGDVRADLYRFGSGLIGSQQLRDAQADFPPLPTGNYQLELTRGAEIVGCVELPITELTDQ